MTRRAWYLVAFLVAIAAGCGPRTDAPSQKDVTGLGGLTVHFLDVGQGDAALLQWDDRAALIDGGPPGAAQTLLDDLQRYHVTRLDWVIASHPHADHIGGLPDVIRAIPVDHFLDSGFNAGSPQQIDLLKAIREKGVDYRIAHEDQTVDMGSGLAMYLFTPPDPLLENTDSDANNNSIVGRVMYGRVRILFPGDMERAERNVIYSHTPGNFEGPKALRADVLKVAHHGSRNGTDEEFLRFVQPKYAVISCETGNSYGHPHAQALKSLQNAGVELHRTDLEGDITLTSDGTTISIAGAHAPAGSEWTPGRRAAHSRRSHSRRTRNDVEEPAMR